MKIAIIGCGLMGSGVASLAAPEAELLLIDREPSKAQALAQTCRGLWSCDLQDAREAELVAVVLPARAVGETFLALAEIVRPGAVVLDMATKGVIPSEAGEKRPDAAFVEAKIVGSGIGVSLGLQALLVVDTRDEALLGTLRAALPGFGSILPGDTALVPQINARGAYWGIRAAVEAEREVRDLGLPEAWVKAVSGCLVPGSTLGLSQGRMGRFNREIADRIIMEAESSHP